MQHEREGKKLAGRQRSTKVTWPNRRRMSHCRRHRNWTPGVFLSLYVMAPNLLCFSTKTLHLSNNYVLPGKFHLRSGQVTGRVCSFKYNIERRVECRRRRNYRVHLISNCHKIRTNFRHSMNLR